MGEQNLDPYSGDVGPWDDDDYFDIPEPDPAIRKEYEAALGRLILVHNNVDRHLTLLIQSALARLGNPPELQRLKHGMFMKRLEALETLNVNPDLGLRHINFVEIRDLNRQRNILAHGHFEQDQFSGAYELITNKETHKDFSAGRIDSLTGRMLAQAKHLEATHDFYDVELEKPPVTETIVGSSEE